MASRSSWEEGCSVSGACMMVLMMSTNCKFPIDKLMNGPAPYLFYLPACLGAWYCGFESIPVAHFIWDAQVTNGHPLNPKDLVQVRILIGWPRVNVPPALWQWGPQLVALWAVTEGPCDHCPVVHDDQPCLLCQHSHDLGSCLGREKCSTWFHSRGRLVLHTLAVIFVSEVCMRVWQCTELEATSDFMIARNEGQGEEMAHIHS